MNAIIWELQENVVSTDYVEVAPQGYQFDKGIKYILHYFTYDTAWTDKENIKKFKKASSLHKYYSKLKRGDLEKDYSFSCCGY